ncbi:MAG: GIY-YIG nuclease family protein [Candidatus Omnitrophica bacterium]|nr:GIY-YIG nuclease family protein [Candidatus Omnitrophota bacterium]
MHYVYALQSQKHDYIYVGITDNLERRLKEHNNGNNCSTKDYVPLKIVYYEAYAAKQDAVNCEYKLKHHGSVIGHLKKRLKNSLTK